MKKFMFTMTAATLLTAFFALQASAAPTKGSPSGPTKSGGVSNVAKSNIVGQNKIASNTLSKVHSNYHLTSGVKFQGGTLYRGRNHTHWTITRFDPRYGCNCYFDGGLSIWFYFCEIDVCYYPVSYCPHQYCSTCVTPVIVEVVTPVCNCTPVIPVCNTCGIGISSGFSTYRTGPIGYPNPRTGPIGYPNPRR